MLFGKNLKINFKLNFFVQFDFCFVVAQFFDRVITEVDFFTIYFNVSCFFDGVSNLY